MRLSVFVFASILGGSLLSTGAMMVNSSVRNPVQPHVLIKAGYRSFSGAVQSISSDGRIRLRDDSLGDIKVVITDQTSISKNGRKGTSGAIRVGTRFHGYGIFRGGNYYARVIMID